jgi:hypothetical protein
MNRPVLHALIRLAAYFYVTAGAVGLVMGWFFAPFVLVLALGLVGANWGSFQRPISARRWIPLVAIASIGLARIVFGGPPGGGGALLS